MIVRARMAPSPTGWLHVGTARATLFNYLFARKNGGAFILRMEDTDLARSDPKYEKDILEGLTWLGITWDEGPYRQSERLHIYEKYLQKLLREGKAFHCSHGKDDLEKERAEQMARREAPRHICAYREKGASSGIIRLKNDTAGTISFDDIIRGPIVFDASSLGDFSLAKDTHTPLFHFAVVVDDHEMNISHVIRGEDHIPNTPKHLVIARALGFSEPRYAHLPLILGPDKSKLSKRHGATAIHEYRAHGYLPEALINFMALLGWNPGDDREIFSLTELEHVFSLEHVQKSGAVFNREKLNWMNGEYIRALTPAALAERITPFLARAGHPTDDHALIERIAAVEQPRLKTLGEVGERAKLFFADPAYDTELLRWKGVQPFEHISAALEELARILTTMPPDAFTVHELTTRIMPTAEERGRGETLWPLRVALSGLTASPDPLEIMSVIGKNASLRRIHAAQKLLPDKQAA